MCMFSKQKHFCKLLFKKQTVDKPKSMIYYSFYKLIQLISILATFQIRNMDWVL